MNEFKDWDVKIGDQIDFFDHSLSYELTGYRPITETEGEDHGYTNCIGSG